MPSPDIKQRLRNLLFLLLGILLVGVPEARAITGGGNANALQGQVQIFKEGAGFVCTGSLISPTWVLTAGHCVMTGELTIANAYVKAGNLAYNQGEVYDLSSISVHPSYQGANNPYYDAALLELTDPVPEADMRAIGYGRGIPGRTSAGNQLPASFSVAGWGSPRGTPAPLDLQVSTQAVLATYTDERALVITPTLPIPGTLDPGDSGAGYIYRTIVCGVHSGPAVLGGVRAKEGATADSLADWILTTSHVLPVQALPDGTLPCETPEPEDESPADAYNAQANEVAVGCFSTVRALFKQALQSLLYQVQRTSDSRSQDISSVYPGGYANSAAQDSFCANTTCTITKIYDQSPFGNDLSIEGSGGNKHSPDSGAVADALPVTIGGHKVYGVSVTPGVGYRNNQTVGVTKNVGLSISNRTAESMYMVTSGLNVNGACCFDFGNVEANSNDNGAGHMDALNFGTYCEFGPCSGSGPWVQADLENGQYMGNKTIHPNSISLPYPFVTAMLTNDGQSNFELDGGSAGGALYDTLYAGALPDGYSMQQEGGIVLGTGGDNSAGGIGSFFEGAIVVGSPSTQTKLNITNNIAQANYSGNSVPTNGEAASYTGTNDQSGPQGDFEQPADEQPNDLMGSRAAMAYYNGEIYAAFQANDTSHKLFITSTNNGTPYPAATNYAGIHIGSAPAMTEFKHQLYVAFQADDASHQLFTTFSASGTDFPAATAHPNILMGTAPAMAEFRHELFLAFRSNTSQGLYVTASEDGQNWPNAVGIPDVYMGSAPSLAVFRSQLFVAFKANDSSNDVWIASSEDGKTFNSRRIAGPINSQTMNPDSVPALVVSNNVLYCIYEAQDLGDEMIIMSTSDGINWQGPAAYLNVHMGPKGPGATAIPVGITVGFQSNDSRNVLFTSFKHTEPLTYAGPNNTGGPQDDFEGTGVEQAPDLMGSKPALVGAGNNIFAAFRANDPTDYLFVASTQIGENYPKATAYPNIRMGSAPAMLAVAKAGAKIGTDPNVYLAFQADDATDDMFVSVSSDGGKSWPAAKQIANVRTGGMPALAYFNHKIYAALQADDSSHNLFITSSEDGQSWPSATRVPNVRIGSDPAMAVLGSNLYVAFRADDSSDDVWIASSSDGANFHSQVLPGQMGGNSSPALVSYNNTLYYICSADDLGNEMLVYASTDGSNWQGPEVYPGIEMSVTGPGASPYTFIVTNPSPIVRSGITVGFQSNDTRNVLYTTTNK